MRQSYGTDFDYFPDTEGGDEVCYFRKVRYNIK